MRFRALRNNKGASTIVLVLFIAFFAILPLGLLAFEISRYMLVEQELRNITDSAALSGTAAMASAPETDSTGAATTYKDRQDIAMNVAVQTFEQNAVLETSFNSGNVSYLPLNPQPPVAQMGALAPKLHHATLNVTLIDQTGAQVAEGTPAATMTVSSYYTEHPIFSSGILPIQTEYTATATANGGLPQLDVILCFDVSGSMDDQTTIWLVNRYYMPKSGKVAAAMTYNTAVTSGGVSGHGNMFSVFGPPYTGTALNVYPPENLADATYADNGVSANTTGFTWSETQDSGGATFSVLKGLRAGGGAAVPNTQSTGMPEQGLSPGTYPNGYILNGAVQEPPTQQDKTGGFTDMVCDMGATAGVPPTNMGTNSSGAFASTVSSNGFPFPNVQTAVEASRGNLESTTALKAACGGLTPTTTQIPASVISSIGSGGYFAAYWTWVLQNASPISVARSSAYRFFNTMNVSSSCHFGLVCFSTSSGTSPTSVWTGTTPTSYTNNNIDTGYSAGGTGTFPNPLIVLNATQTSLQEFTNVTQALVGTNVNTAIPPQPLYSSSSNPVVAEGATDLVDALTEAEKEMGVTGNTSFFRTTAKHAIVVFTDGVPDVPAPAATAAADALALGTTAYNGQEGPVPIYTIGLSANAQIVTPEENLLGDSSTYPGLAYESNGGQVSPAQYIPVSTAADLDQAFQSIARSLCVLH